MTSSTVAAPEPNLNGLVGQLFASASRRPRVIAAGWVLALGSHALTAWFFAQQHTQALTERQPPAVDVEFVTPPAPPPEFAPPDQTKAASASAAPAPPAAARAGALHLAKADIAPAQQTEQAVDFTNDPNGASYGGGVVAVGGTAAFGAASARVASAAGSAPLAPVTPHPAVDALVPAADLSQKPRLPGADPCRGFFPSGAQDDVGDVAVIVTINKSGRVTNTQLLAETPAKQGFGAAARSCLASQQFTPALDRAGNSAATAVRVNLRFSR